ncbi:hypothetical protein DACRYDRAFT_76774 [Dacryopinax primogenitus]|uniref:Uncharacterized protein n=1 Tax=Dacryopinax primogenitus (strain DJM 731) TaxID=1858805 RepID=M5G2B9_DACPD|nr:uncharacterized protein DACRYDRAFT_76774 [Dacryopinax primogenitus]EJU04351.1 hypothetical protein DACRYDRAFT_76774 [Dacryopinax primogenitus]
MSAIYPLLPLLPLLPLVTGYIPAVPTNNTASLPVFNTTSLSTFTLKWEQHGHQPLGIYSTAVSYQLPGNGSAGVTQQGAFVHFTEDAAADSLNTTTLWIAFISCDHNVTGASTEDIFTLAQERGAVSALLYSAYSQSCLLNPAYLSREFYKPIDVFVTTSQQSVELIESQFEQVNASFYSYDASLLTQNALLVNESLADMETDQATYLVGLFQVKASDNTTSPNTSSGAVRAASTPDTMIMLYVTACISLLLWGVG